MDGPSVAATYRAAAIETIKAEHRALGEVLQLFQHLLRDIIAQHVEADYTLLCAALYYIDDFACRCHHPKEDQYLFPAIRRHASEAGTTLSGLQAEHQRDDLFVKDLHRLLVLYQAGAPGALKRLSASFDIYATMLCGHMRREEGLLDAFADAIPQKEWQAIAEGFGREDEPL